MFAVCMPSIALTLIVPPLSVVTQMSMSPPAHCRCGHPMDAVGERHRWRQTRRSRPPSRRAPCGFDMSAWPDAVMTMGISEHEFTIMTWFAKNFGRYGC
jgi:hypothetical protein